jgi:hypothetical protein
MPLDQTAIIKQIDDVLAKCQGASGATEISRALGIVCSAIRRLAPRGSYYTDNVQKYEARAASGVTSMALALVPIEGMLRALRDDYERGYLQSVTELVHADIFSDFLDMASYLLQEGYKDPAAVVAGSVLESHLRKLCNKHGIAVAKPDSSPKKADTSNADPAGADIYSKLDQKSVTAWLDLRNKAAHGQFSEYTKEQVTLMLQGVRDFASRYPA